MRPTRSIPVALMTLALATAGAARAATLADDTRDVQHVLDAYHEAVVSHDGARLAALFIPQGSTWLNVLSDATFAAARARSPGALKVRVGSAADFAQLVSASPAQFNPTRTQLQVHSDGTIAAVTFDFVFYIDGKAQNHGSEAWQLVNGSAGWRIAAITYSSQGAPE